MKTSKLLFMSVMLFGALTLASCGSSGEKAKTEEAKVECTHDHEEHGAMRLRRIYAPTKNR